MKKGLVAVAGVAVVGLVGVMVAKKIKRAADEATELAEMKKDFEAINELLDGIVVEEEKEQEECIENGEIKVVYLNNSKQDILGFMEDLASGKFDNVLNGSMFNGVKCDKDRIAEKLANGKSIEEAFDEMYDENLEQMRQTLGGAISERELVDIYNESITHSMYDEVLETMKDMLSEEEYKVFERAIEMAKNVRFEYVA